MQYTLHIIRKPVKYLRLKILDGHNVQAIAPKLMSRRQIQNFVEKKQFRIHKHLSKQQQANANFVLEENQILLHGVPYTPMHRAWQGTKYMVDHKNKLIRWWYDLMNEVNTTHRYKTYAKNTLPGRLTVLASKHSIDYDRCTIRDQKTKRWSCSSRWHIWLNRRLIKMPDRVADYVMLHELAHRTHMNHSQQFWEHCTQLCPRTADARVRLKQFGSALH